MEKLLIVMVFIGMFTSCEDTVEVDLNTSEPRLVIEANINLLENGTAESTVKLTTTAPFFNAEIPVVEDAEVRILDGNEIVYNFIYTENGIYIGSIIPEENLDYTLQVIYQGEIYSATTRLKTAVPLEFVEQRNDGGFTGEDIELKVYFTDPGGVDNYYYFEGFSSAGNIYDTFYDEFFDGNSIFGFYLVEGLEAGDEVTFNLYGVDEQFYNFMFTLLQQTGEANDGPFETQPATVRGNIINETNGNNFPLGYFRVSEKYSLEYIVQ